MEFQRQKAEEQRRPSFRATARCPRITAIAYASACARASCHRQAQEMSFTHFNFESGTEITEPRIASRLLRTGRRRRGRGRKRSARGGLDLGIALSECVAASTSSQTICVSARSNFSHWRQEEVRKKKEASTIACGRVWKPCRSKHHALLSQEDMKRQKELQEQRIKEGKAVFMVRKAAPTSQHASSKSLREISMISQMAP